ncbi:MAG: hypothetical protein Q4A44_04120 [Bacteroidales bacterium]|nr:hypothetical protein [Bacteroidales bacterium]
MRRIIPFAMLLLASSVFYACSETEEKTNERIGGRPAAVPAPELPPSKAGLYRHLYVVESNPFTKRLSMDYAIGGFYEADGVELVNVEGRRELHFKYAKAYETTNDPRYLDYVRVYGDRKDIMVTGYSVNLALVANVDGIRVEQFDPKWKRYTNVSNHYALIYQDVYDYVSTPPRLPKMSVVIYTNEAVRRVSDCDKRVCRWAFDDRVCAQIQPLASANPDANTSLLITLSDGQQLRVAWTDTIPSAKYARQREFWEAWKNGK